jgi:hypothetical protein
MEPEHPKAISSRKGSASPGERIRSVIKEALKLENLPFVVLIFLAGISLISRLWLIRH